MLLPFQFAILTVEDARLLQRYLRDNFKGMHQAGLADLYERLDAFLVAADHYQHELRDFDPDNFERRRD